MALQKEIELENGIVVNYHRIVSITKITNQLNSIEVASYISAKKREEEQQALEIGIENGEAIETNIFIDTTYINKDYDETETIEDAYDYLKTLDKFKKAKDC